MNSPETTRTRQWENVILLIEHCVFTYALISFGIYFSALAGIARPLPVTILCIFTTAGSFFWFFHYNKDRLNVYPTFSVRSLLLFAIVFLPLVHIFLIPPFMRDDCIYHLVVPEYIARTGTYPVDPFNINSNFPMLFEMPLVLQQWISEYVSPNLFNFVFLILLCAASVAVCRVIWHLPFRHAFLPVPFIVYSPVMYDLVHSAYTEIFFSLLIILATYEYQKFNCDRTESNHLYRCIILLGIGCSVKYFSMIFVILLFTVEFFKESNRKRLYSSLLIMVLLAMPWYIKNWITLHNPFFPLFNFFFQSPYISDLRLQAFRHLAHSYNAGYSIPDLILLPFRLLTGHQPELQPGRLGFDGSFSLFFALVFAGIGIRKTPRLIVSAVFCVYLLFWGVTSHVARYLFPVLIPVTISGMARISALLEKKKFVIIPVTSLLLIHAVFLTYLQSKQYSIDSLILHRISTDQFLTTTMPGSYGMARYVNTHLDPQRDKIWLIGTYGRNYYFSIPTIAMTYLDTEPFTSHFKPDSISEVSFQKYFDSLGVTHVLINTHYFRRVHQHDNLVDVSAVQKHFESKWEQLHKKGEWHLLGKPENHRYAIQ